MYQICTCICCVSEKFNKKKKEEKNSAVVYMIHLRFNGLSKYSLHFFRSCRLYDIFFVETSAFICWWNSWYMHDYNHWGCCSNICHTVNVYIQHFKKNCYE